MEKILLEVTEGAYSTAKEARAADRIPMVYYGKGVDNHGFSVDYQAFRRAYEKGGRSTIMYFKNEKNEDFPILVQDIQYEPVTDEIIHIDVMAVQMGKLITTKIPLTLVGVSPAVKDLSGVLIQSKDSVEVECLPKDLMHEIEVDISPIAEFHHSLTVGDVKVPDTIKILDSEDINIVMVSAPRSAVEEEETTAEGEGEAAEGEGEAAEGGEGEAKSE